MNVGREAVQPSCTLLRDQIVAANVGAVRKAAVVCKDNLSRNTLRTDRPATVPRLWNINRYL
ncbi:hypothetical protein [Flexibacterium corallicola]|uniref:hypothetical protein n=1 Tax=Flexibacterium corallicola TaxID=3037259 RepID=UPI00286F20A6|nr:hypothetical protein [Pseudovibrio sp. M1P-2-3]